MIQMDRGSWGESTFADEKELLDYLVRHESFYSPLAQYMGQSQSSLQGIRNAKSYLETYLANPAQQAQYRQHAIDTLPQIHQGNGGLPPLDTTDGEFVRSFALTPELAGKIGNQLSNAPNPTTDHQAALIVTAYRYPKLTGTKGWSFASAAADKLKAFENELGKMAAVRIKVNEDGTSALAIAKKGHEDLLKEHDNALQDQLEKAETDWTTLRETYDSQLALQAPRTYWERQRDDHRNGSIAAQGNFRKVGVGSFVVAIAMLIFIWSAMANKSGEIPIALWLLSGAILGTAFWVIRLFSRLYLSREHLARDAEERVTMIETYLALVQHGRVKEDDLKFVLASIFRPTEDGLVKDDSLPSPLLDLFQQGRAGK